MNNYDLTNGFKKFKCKSYSIDKNGYVNIHKKTPSTDWSLYLKDVLKTSYGQFKIDIFKNQKGIKKIQFFKPLKRVA